MVMKKFFFIVACMSVCVLSLGAQAGSGEFLKYTFMDLKRTYHQPILRHNSPASEIRKYVYEGFLKKHQSCGNDSLLTEAVLAGDADRLKTLISQGADSKAIDKNGMTALRCAVMLGEAECARILFEAGARLGDPVPKDVIFPENFNVTDVLGIISFAVTYDNADLIKVVLAAEGDLIKNDAGAFVGIINLIVNRGAAQTLEYVLEAGKEIEYRKELFPGVIHSALILSSVVPIRLDKVIVPLIKAGLNVQDKINIGLKERVSHLHVAACADGKYSESNILELLKAGVSLDERDGEGRTALHNAALCENVRNARLLIFAGANISATDFQGRTPLHSATEQGNSHGETFRTRFWKKLPSILEAPTLKTSQGYHPDVVQLLAEAGADPLAKNKLSINSFRLTIWKNDLDQIIAFLSGGMRIDDSLQTKVECFNDLKRLSRCLRSSEIPSKLYPVHDFSDQKPVCLNICSVEKLSLDRCITDSTPIISRPEIWALVLFLTLNTAFDYSCGEGKCRWVLKSAILGIVMSFVFSYPDFID